MLVEAPAHRPWQLLPPAGVAPREPERVVNTFMFMSNQQQECEQKAAECERIAANLANKDDEPFRRIHLDLAAKWREKAAGIAAARRRGDQRFP